MASFKDQHKRAAGNSTREEPDKVPKQLEDLTNLAMVLMGYEDTPGHYTKGCTLTIWWADSRLKFSINDKANKLVGFGVVKGEFPLGDAIELAIEGEEVEWKDKDENNGRR